LSEILEAAAGPCSQNPDRNPDKVSGFGVY